MTEQEVKPWIGKPIRATLADGRVLAGTLHVDSGHGHGHTHYLIVSAPIREGDKPVTEMLHGTDTIATIEDASKDPAASEKT